MSFSIYGVDERALQWNSHHKRSVATKEWLDANDQVINKKANIWGWELIFFSKENFRLLKSHQDKNDYCAIIQWFFNHPTYHNRRVIFKFINNNLLITRYMLVMMCLYQIKMIMMIMPHFMFLLLSIFITLVVGACS